MEQAGLRATPTEVEAVYELFLGRAPESVAAVEQKLSLPIEGLVEQVVSSQEFREGVLRPLLRGRPGDDDRFDAPASAAASAWAQSALAIEASFGPSDTWGLLLLDALAVARTNNHRWRGFDDVEPSELLRVRAVRRRGAGAAALAGALEAGDETVVEGWALDRSDPDRPLFLELVTEGAAPVGIRPDRFRRDLQDRFGGAGVFGFRVRLPALGRARADENGVIAVDLLEATSGRRLDRRMLNLDRQPQLDALSQIATLLDEVNARLRSLEHHLPEARAAVSFSVNSYDGYRRAYRGMGPSQLEAQRQDVAQWTSRPRFVVSVASEGAHRGMDLAVSRASAERQSYPEWRWANDDKPARTGDYVIRLRAGDELEPDALFHVAQSLRVSEPPLVLTVDGDKIERGDWGAVRFHAPRLRPAHDPWLQLQRPDASGVLAVEAELLTRCGVSDLGGGAADTLRLMLEAGAHRVAHLPRVLHHQAAEGRPPPDDEAGFADIVRREVLKAGARASVVPHEDMLGADVPGAVRIRPEGPQARLVSLIIPTKDRLDLLQPCVEGLLATREANATPFELLIVDNGGNDASSARFLEELTARDHAQVLHDPSPFNWAQLNNRAAQKSSGDVLLFLNDDTIPVSPAWCDELCLWATWPGAGVAGGRLVYDDGTLQHAGVVTGVYGTAAHEGVGAAGEDAGYLGRHALVHRASAVTGACMAVRRACFAEMQGFDERWAVSYNDVDFCLRAQASGWAVLYAPQAVFHHFESKTRRFDAQLEGDAREARKAEADALRQRWGDRLDADPWYNPHFERWAAPFSRLRAKPD